MANSARYTAVCCVAVALLLSGCATWSATQRATVDLNYPHAKGELLGQSAEAHYHVVRGVSARDTHALVDDLDLLFLTDRPTRLTRWHDR
jgi:hypothetical protein